MMSRDLARLCPRGREMFAEFAVEMERCGIPFMVTSVERTIVEQMALFVQGRLEMRDVNRFRQAAGMYPLPATENRIVTWTLQSLHVTDPFDAREDNDLSRAVDIAILKNGRPTWDLKVNVNDNDLPDYQEAARIWTALGGTAGAFWNTPDPCHFQV